MSDLIKYVVVAFIPPEYDQNAEFDLIVGIYDDKEVADDIVKGHNLATVYPALYYPNN